MSAKAIARALLPPIALDAARALRPKPPPAPPPFTFSEPYASWEAASAGAGGYDAPNILAKVRDAALKVKHGELAYEQEGIGFSEPSPKWEMLACLLSTLVGSPHPHVVDFGGSLGTLYYRHRTFLDGVDWSVVEQPNFVACGRTDFEDDRLRFYEALPEALGRASADVLLCGSVLQVIPEPFALVRSAAEARVPYLLIDRTPIYDVEQDTIVVIHVSAAVNESSYPYRKLARSTFASQLRAAGYEIIQTYERDNRPGFFCRLVERPAPSRRKA